MRRRLIAPAILATLCAAVACSPPSEPPSQEAAGQDAVTRPSLPPEQLGFARDPISYFNQECGSCHGNYGSFWGEGFAAAYDDAGLRDVVDEMAAGPAQAPLEGLALDVQVAYHRSLVDGKPFVTVYVEEGKLRGEVTPGSEVVLVVEGREQAATVEKHVWRSELREASAVRVTKEGKQTELDLGAGEKTVEGAVVYSHASAAPAKKE
jgi:hypothetical protein